MQLEVGVLDSGWG